MPLVTTAAMFGKAYAGGGGGKNGGRYETGAIANIFRDTLQLSILGYSNNLNRPGFGMSDLLQNGGISRTGDVAGSRSNSVNNGNFGSSISINGINFGGISQLGGITTSNGAGFNLNHSPNTKKAFYAQYYFGNVRTKVTSNTETKTFNGDTIINYNALYNALVKGNTHTFGLGFNLKPDTVTTIIASANYVLATEKNNNQTNTDGVHSYFGNLNTGQVNINKKTDNNILRENFTFIRLSKIKTGRRIVFLQGLTGNVQKVNSYTDANIHYLYPLVFDSLTNQLRKEEVPTWFAFSNVNYREPLSKKFSFRAAARYEYTHLKNNIATFGGNNYSQKNDLLSQNFSRNSNRFWVGAGLEFKYKELSITPYVRYQYQNFDNRLSSVLHPVIQKLNNILPQLEIVFRKLNINYSREIVLPNSNYMIPVINNTNPYVVNLGNTDLLPTVQDRVSMNLNTFNPKTQINVWGNAQAWIAKNDIVNSYTMDASGVQTVLPINVNGSKNFTANFGVSQTIKYKHDFNFSWNIGTWTRYNQSLFYYNKEESTQNVLYSSVWGNLGFNWNDKLELNPSYSFYYANVKNSNPLFNRRSSFEQTMGLEAIFRYVKHFIFDSEINYLNNNAFVDPKLKKMLMWNVGINLTFFKDERAVLRLSGNDILNKTVSTGIEPDRNVVSIYNSNVLGQYFLATFTYNLRPSGSKAKAGGGWSLW
jgi:hypothetical protein